MIELQQLVDIPGVDYHLINNYLLQNIYSKTKIIWSVSCENIIHVALRTHCVCGTQACLQLAQLIAAI